MNIDRPDLKSTKEPIAITGIGCRFPGGVKDPESFWQLLRDGVDAIREIPPDRMDVEAYYDPEPGVPGRMSTRWGGFLDKIDEFDADFFGISPREAERLDPQQRLLLEVAWEAIEDAGQAPEHLAGTQTGVFIGLWLNDFEARLYHNPAGVDFYMTTGSGRYTASGRLSYVLGLQGASITLDTHCSSSLVAVHLACQSIWSGESTLALAGGANIILQPHVTIAYSQSNMMALDGRCKFGDARADGYVRSEGAGIVVLKPYSQAAADGDEIYALILGSAASNHGRSSGFLATPSRQGQEALLRQAFENAGISPKDVSYVEAHGTGTQAGDPVEIEAIGRVLGTDRSRDSLCAVGSVKTNFGHTESAAGVAGLIKAVLSIKHRAIPASLHLTGLNPEIPWNKLPIFIPTELTPWTANGRPAYAGVSSFGIAGTNAHVVLGEAPRRSPDSNPAVTDAQDWHLLPLSARTPEALRALAQAYSAALTREKGPPFRDICYSASVRRAHHEHRLAIVGSDRKTAAAALNDYLDKKQQRDRPSSSSGPARRHKLAFIFPGMGSQWTGMGRGLLEREPVFREAVNRFDRAIQPFTDWSIIEQLTIAPGDPRDRRDQIDVIQPILLAIEIGLAELWRSWGVMPEAVSGHSMGEIGAAYLAGALSLEDTARIICYRSQLLREISGRGAMAVVGLGMEAAREAIKGYEDTLDLAASNSFRSTVLSGDPAHLEEALEGLRDRDIFCRRMNVEVAFHSQQVEPLAVELVRRLEGLQPRAGSIPLYSTAAGITTDGSDLGAAYWGKNLRSPVLFAATTEQLLADGFTHFLELSPHPILIQAVEETIHHLRKEAITVPSLKRDEPEKQSLLKALGKLYTAGYELDFNKSFGEGARFVRLPAYPWQRKRHWLESADIQSGWKQDLWPAEPLLGRRLPQLAHLPGQHIWDNRVNTEFRRRLQPLLPVETETLPERMVQKMALSAATSVFGAKTHTVHRFTVQQPLPLSGAKERQLQFLLDTNSANGASSARRAAFALYSRDREESPWTEHASGQLQVGQAGMDWFYQVEWAQRPKGQPDGNLPAPEEGHWLIFSDRGGAGEALARKLESLDQTCTLLYRQVDGPPVEPGGIMVDTNRPEGFTQAIDEVGAGEISHCRGIVYLWNLDLLEGGKPGPVSFEEAQQVACHHIVSLVQALLRREWDAAPRLWLVTSSAQAVDPASASSQANLPAELPLSLVQALTWGLGRTIALEQSDIWGGMVDLPSDYTLDSAADDLSREILTPDGEDQIAYREGQRFTARLAPSQHAEPGKKPLPIDPEAAYLITGGLGTIGLAVARRLAEQNVGRLVLISRTGLPERDRWENIAPDSPTGKRVAAVQAIEALGARVTVARADVSNPAQMAEVLAGLDRDGLPVKGILHTAAVFVYQPIGEMSPATIDQVLRSKVKGTWLLHELTKDRPLDFFILFASTTGILGSQGLSIYAAANHFLDQVAHFRAGAGLPGLSIDWGVWAGDNLETAELTQLAGQSGLRPIPGELAYEALTYLLKTGAVQKFVADIDWNTLKPLYESKRSRPLLSLIKVEKPLAPANADGSQENEFLKKLARASKNKRRELLISHISAQVREILGVDPSEPIDIRQGFFKLGMDSLMSLQLHKRMETSLNVSWPTTVALEYPSIATLTDYIVDEALPLILQEKGEALAPPVQEARPVQADLAQEDLNEISDQELMGLLDGELSRINDMLDGD